MDCIFNYSVIIPHKNIPELLQRCLDSIPRREDIQIIVVDDDSDPDIVDFENFPGVKDNCVEVYLTKEGRGAGYARNVGLSKAKGKWLLFADADDFYTPGAWDIFDRYKSTDFDIIYFSICCVDTITLAPANRNLNTNKVISDFIEKKYNSEARLRYTCWEPWNKMFRSCFVQSAEISFEEIARGNDAMFVIKAGAIAQKIVADSSVVYALTFRSSSLSYAPKKEYKMSSLLLKIRMNEFYKKSGHPEFRLSVLYDIKEVYTLFGLFEALKYCCILLSKRADFFCFFITDRKKIVCFLRRCKKSI